MFFYCKGANKDLNFVIFDVNLRSIEFNSAFIVKNKNKHFSELVAFENIYNDVYGEAIGEGWNDMF